MGYIWRWFWFIRLPCQLLLVIVWTCLLIDDCFIQNVGCFIFDWTFVLLLEMGGKTIALRCFCGRESARSTSNDNKPTSALAREFTGVSLRIHVSSFIILKSSSKINYSFLYYCYLFIYLSLFTFHSGHHTCHMQVNPLTNLVMLQTISTVREHIIIYIHVVLKKNYIFWFFDFLLFFFFFLYLFMLRTSPWYTFLGGRWTWAR